MKDPLAFFKKPSQLLGEVNEMAAQNVTDRAILEIYILQELKALKLQKKYPDQQQNTEIVHAHSLQVAYILIIKNSITLLDAVPRPTLSFKLENIPQLKLRYDRSS